MFKYEPSQSPYQLQMCLKVYDSVFVVVHFGMHIKEQEVNKFGSFVPLSGRLQLEYLTALKICPVSKTEQSSHF